MSRVGAPAVLLFGLVFSLGGRVVPVLCEEECSSLENDTQTAGNIMLQQRRLATRQSDGRACGAAWTDDMALSVIAKLKMVFKYPLGVYNELKAKYGDIDCHTGFADEGPDAQVCDGKDGRESGRPGVESLPFAPKFVRLGFHDCVKYKDGTGGCDGCLKFYDMFMKYNDLASGNKRNMRRDDPVSGTNNGLYIAADVLEEIWTNPAYPRWTTNSGTSLKDSGVSRADLWAFAAQVATDYSMTLNNDACDGNEQCGGHLYNIVKPPFPCKITTARNLVFRTGRCDCPDSDKPVPDAQGRVKTEAFELPEGHRFRAYETLKVEDTPNPSGNASMITDYMKRVFGFSKKETVTIMGAHSLGKMHGKNGLWKYEWQWMQNRNLNNNYYRMLAAKPGVFLNCEATWHNLPFRWAGGPNRELAQSGWFVRPIRKCKSAGPYEWFHYYIRCPECYKDSQGNWVNRDLRGDANFKSTECCSCHELPADQVDPKCWTPDQKTTKDETMIGTDMAMAYEFNVDEATGFPSGCPGMGKEWTIENVVEQGRNGARGVPWDMRVKFYNTEPLCPKNSLRDDPSSLSMGELVEFYADNQDAWANDFYNAWEKMLSNGYGKGELREGPDVLGISRTSCNARTCTLNFVEK